MTGQPVRTLINTHHHGDHTFGNYLFGGATIVAHEQCRQEMLAFGPPGAMPFWTEIDWGDLEACPPFLTYTEGGPSTPTSCAARYGTSGPRPHDQRLDRVDSRRSLLFSGDLVFTAAPRS